MALFSNRESEKETSHMWFYDLEGLIEADRRTLNFLPLGNWVVDVDVI